MAKGDPFGQRLKKARLTEGLTQADVAKKLHVSGATISNWEAGKSNPSSIQRKQLSRLLGHVGDAPERTFGDETEGEGKPSPFGVWLRQSRYKADLSVHELAVCAGVSVPTIYFLENGRTQLPMEQTRKRLEQALKQNIPDEITKEAEAEQNIKGLGSLTDFDPHAADDRPRCPGVYVFYDISERPVYVGKAKSIAKRVKAHEEKFWFKSPIVQRASFIEIKNAQLRHQIEQILIKFLKSNAVLNKQGVDRGDDQD